MSFLKKIVKVSEPKISKKDKVLSTSPDKHFWLFKGGSVKSIPELKQAILNMTDEQFNHHTKEGRNDFANWLEKSGVIAISVPLSKSLALVTAASSKNSSLNFGVFDFV